MGILYGFTIKDLKTKETNLNESVYEFMVLKDWAKRGKIISKVYEDKRKDGSKARLHVHGVIEFDKKPFIQTLCKKGFAVKLEEIYDLDGWIRYIDKNTDHQTPLFKYKCYA